jgi:CheY-like chemotaxis protein
MMNMVRMEGTRSALRNDLAVTSAEEGTRSFPPASTRSTLTLEAAAQTPDGAEPTSPPTVLIVDDDPRNLFALESVLEGGNYAIAKAQSGNEALLALMNQEFAAIVLDVQMPEVSGIELARLIKQRRRTQHIPIIFLTAHYLEEEHAVLAYDVGAVDYLTKPINPLVLRSKVNVFVDLFRKTRALAS